MDSGAGQHFSVNDLRELIALRLGPGRVPRRLRVVTDTTDFFRVEYDDVLILAGVPYFVRRYEKEGRFGLDEQPKYWVRRAIDLRDGSLRVIKMVFHEEFTAHIAGVAVHCYRSPKKEARILGLVAEHPHFMHGTAVEDEAGNNVRVLEFIRGPCWDTVVTDLPGSHQEYFHRDFPSVLDTFLILLEAIRHLHLLGEKHGDIRRDHILLDRETGLCRWIDFDYTYEHGESMFGFDLQGLGNILLFLAGRGDVLVQDLHAADREAFDSLDNRDLSLSFRNRVANLRKVYPYIPESLNLVLLHFSEGASLFYDTAEQMLDDLAVARADIRARTGR